MSNRRERKRIIYVFALAFCILLLPMAQVYASVPQFAELSIEVELDGQSEPDAGKETFLIQISPEDEGNPMPENAMIRMEGAGTDSFVIPYDQMGTYVYMVKQVKGQSSNIEYSSETYQVILQVIEEHGRKGYLSIRSESSGGKVDQILFSNSVIKSGGEDTDKDKEDTDKGASSTDKAVSGVNTDDSTSLYLWMAVFALSFLSIVLSACVSKYQIKRWFGDQK